MSWLKLNDSFNNIKGQISNFANNVLAEEPEDENTAYDGPEQLERLCAGQKEEIEKLKKINEELNQQLQTSKKPINPDGSERSDSNNWSWDLPSPPPEPSKTNTPKELSHLKETIQKLENEKKELAANLDLLNLEFLDNSEQLAQSKKQLQKDYNELEDEHTELKQKHQNLLSKTSKDQKIISDLKVKHEELLLELKEKDQTSLKNESQNHSVCAKCEELAKENEALTENVQSLKNELSIISSNTAVLNKILEDTQNTTDGELRNLKEELKLAQSENKILVGELKKTNEVIEQHEKRRNVEAEHCKRLDFILSEYEREVSSLKQEISELRSGEGSSFELEEELENVRGQLSLAQGEMQNAHKKYINILSDNIKRYIDCDKSSDFEHPSTEDDLQEFSNQVASIFKILLDFKCKCEKLEGDLYNATQEKTNLLTEKNHEIEKLLHNSEILSQEVITKSQTIKEYENECNDLIKNNDLLINELERYKNNSGLQTISESNEDNLLMLEAQLDNANKRIEELEKRNRGIEEIPEVPEVPDQEQFYKLEAENSELKIAVRRLEEDQDEANEDKEKLIVAYDRMKADLENTEYQYTEINVSMEMLKEEIENQKKKVEELLKQNVTLEKVNTEYERNNEEVRAQLNDIREKLLYEEDTHKLLENQVRTLTEKLQNAKMSETSLKLQHDTVSKELLSVTDAKLLAELKLKEFGEDFRMLQENAALLAKTNEELRSKCADLEKLIVESRQNEALIDVPLVTESSKPESSNSDEINSTALQEMDAKLLEALSKIDALEKQIHELNAAKTELTNVVLTKHQENIAYHNELQRLSQMLNAEVAKCQVMSQHLEEARTANVDSAKMAEECDKLTDQNQFLRQKCEVLADNLLQEQSKVQQVLAERSNTSEKEEALAKKLERLQTHLIEVEEHYTQELLKAEEKNAELQTKVNEIEQREKNSTNMYTSVSIRANQHVETLQQQLQLITKQRDDLRKKISDAEDQVSKQAAALANLQFVLEQFQKDKEKDVQKETERIRRQVDAEKRIQDSLKNEVHNLQTQLEESRHGLQAAARLSDQLEHSKQLISTLKMEVAHLKDKLTKSEEQIKSVTGQTDGKVDKSLVKNLFIGFVSTNNNLNKDQTQILKIIATVLDFNQQDHDKINLNKPQQGWLSSLLAPQASQGMSQESLSQAFVKFLENESKPRVLPSLLNESSRTSSRKSSTSVPPSNSRQSPSVLSEITLPTFADFAQSRNSSSILKDVLKDNS